MKTILIALVSVAVFVGGLQSLHAQVVERGDEFAYKLQVPFPSAFDTDGGGDQVVTTTRGVAELAIQLFGFAIAIGGLLAMAMLVYAGFRWATSAGNASAVGEAKQRMTDAVLGLILLGTAWVILRTINPSFLLIQEPILDIQFDVDGCPIDIRGGDTAESYECRAEAEKKRNQREDEAQLAAYLDRELEAFRQKIASSEVTCEEIGKEFCTSTEFTGNSVWCGEDQAIAFQKGCSLYNTTGFESKLGDLAGRCGYAQGNSFDVLGRPVQFFCNQVSSTVNIERCEDVKNFGDPNLSRDACKELSANIGPDGEQLSCVWNNRSGVCLTDRQPEDSSNDDSLAHDAVMDPDQCSSLSITQCSEYSRAPNLTIEGLEGSGFVISTVQNSCNADVCGVSPIGGCAMNGDRCISNAPVSIDLSSSSFPSSPVVVGDTITISLSTASADNYELRWEDEGIGSVPFDGGACASQSSCNFSFLSNLVQANGDEDAQTKAQQGYSSRVLMIKVNSQNGSSDTAKVLLKAI